MLLHGRGRRSRRTCSLLADRIGDPDVAFPRPRRRATERWYPQSFLAPLVDNEPWLSSALGVVEALMISLGDHSRVVLGGFSQGACLAAEYALRFPGRYGGLLLYTGGFIGPPGTVPPRMGSFEGTPAYLGTSDPDGWVPPERVRETAAALTTLGAVVELDVFAGMDHLVNDAGDRRGPRAAQRLWLTASMLWPSGSRTNAP